MSVNSRYPSAVIQGLKGDLELRRIAPRYPRVASGVSVIEGTNGAAIIYGGLRPEVISGEAANATSIKLVNLLDGSRDLDYWLNSLDKGSLDLFAFFFMHGLLREGKWPEPPEPDQVFADLRVGETSWHSSGEELRSFMASFELAFVTDDKAIETRFINSLRGAGFHRTRSVTADTVLIDDNMVYFCRNRSKAREFFKRVRYFPVRLIWIEAGGGLLRLGPRILKDTTCSPDCVMNQTKSLDQGYGSRPEEALVLALSVNHAVTALCRLNSRPLENRSTLIDIRNRLVSCEEPIARLRRWSARPGTREAYLTVPQEVESDWVSYNTTVLQGTDAAVPVAYLSHYREENVSHDLYQSRRFSTDAEIPLSRLSNIDGYTALANALEVCFGTHHDGHKLRRMVPSGGNLGSTKIILSLGDAPELGLPGLYEFFPETSSLAHIVGIESLPLSVPSSSSSVRCFMLGDVARVAQKYGPLARFIVNYDAGVMAAAWSATIRSLTRATTVFSDISVFESLAVLGEASGGLAPILSTVYEPSLFGPSAAGKLLSLSDEFSRRRAVRAWKRSDLEEGQITDIEELTRQSLRSARKAWSGNVDLNALIVIRTSQGSSIRRVSERNSSIIRCLPNDEVPLLFAQREINQAPAAIFPLFDLASAAPFGGLDPGLRRAGYVAGELWFKADRQSFAGTLCGATLEGEVRRLSGLHDISDVLSLGLALGEHRKTE